MNWNRHRKETLPEVATEEKTPEQKTEDPTPAETLEKKAELIPETKIFKETAPAAKPIEAKKKRIDTKIFNNVGIVGDTIEVKDFRAIVKRNGEQINTVLTKLISDYNRKNYNL